MNTTTTRTIRGLAAAGFALALLAGCASAPDASTGGDAEPAPASELTGTLTVSAAASLQPAFEQLTAAFQELHPGVTFEGLTFDGSSTLATQIIGGAPVDVFASADENNMDKVAEEGLLASDPVIFATSSLQIAVAPGNPLGIETLADLVKPGPDGELPIVVVCAPEVPCGAASQQLLERDDVALEPVSEEQNVTAVLTKVSNDEADAGLIYRSDVLRSDGAVEGIEIEGSIEAAGSYVIAPLAGSGSPDAAQAFADFMLSDEAQSLFEQLGFGPA
ncbi:molybdate ABC transporter substrate-binding protein [Leucobacter soli]|uniref:Molybdate-binding protein ModA n=1 Tax=Leucobacter soli TaxID=2812850 RepID=A0A916NF07_9MICO|nr:molybdate ABC transporter substrate-binding protein [Leucobacter soli]CAG7599498.1 Molybdate-binding protein ModA [Leucobacter soli]